jgi:hypothetical protein
MEELTALYRTKTDNDQGLGKFHNFHPPLLRRKALSCHYYSRCSLLWYVTPWVLTFQKSWSSSW